MRLLKKRPGAELEVIEVKNELQNLQEAVGGYIQTVPFVNDIVMLCDEEGELKGKDANFPYNDDLIVGDVVFLGTALGEFRGLTDTEIGLIKTIFELGVNTRKRSEKIV